MNKDIYICWIYQDKSRSTKFTKPYVKVLLLSILTLTAVSLCGNSRRIGYNWLGLRYVQLSEVSRKHGKKDYVVRLTYIPAAASSNIKESDISL